MNTTTETMNASMEQAAQNMIQACEEANALAREQMDATMRSANAYVQGYNEIGQNLSGWMQESVSRAVNAGRTIMSAKSLREMIELQNEFAKDFFDYWVAGTGKISEISARVTKEAVDPLAEHANNTMNKLAQRTKAAA